MYGTPRRAFGPPEATTGILPFGVMAVVMVCLIADTLDVGEHRQVVIAGGALGVGFCAWWHIVARSVMLIIYDEGMVYQSKARQFSVRWSDIESIRYREVQINIHWNPVGVLRRIRITDRSGQTYRLGNSIKDSGDFLAELIRRTQPQLIRKAADELKGGREVTFGPIRLSPTAVSGPRLLGRQSVPLRQLRSHSVSGGRLTVAWNGGRFVVSVSRVPNVSVLCALLTERESSPAG